MSLARVIDDFNPNYYGDAVRTLSDFRTNGYEAFSGKGILVKKILADGLSLSQPNNVEYGRLEAQLVSAVATFSSGQSYSSVALNEVGDNFLTILSYVELLGQTFNS